MLIRLLKKWRGYRHRFVPWIVLNLKNRYMFVLESGLIHTPLWPWLNSHLLPIGFPPFICMCSLSQTFSWCSAWWSIRTTLHDSSSCYQTSWLRAVSLRVFTDSMSLEWHRSWCPLTVFLQHNVETLQWNYGQETGHANWGLPWFASVLRDKSWNSTSNWAVTPSISLPILTFDAP